MNKSVKFLVVGLISAIISSQAMAATAISCGNNPNSRLEAKVTFQAKVISSSELANVVMTVVPKDSTFKAEAGRAARLSADLKYTPRKYLNTNRFSTEKLKGASGHTFLPMDECAFQILLPNKLANIGSGTKFQIPTLVHCDQSGGFEPMFCSVQ